MYQIQHITENELHYIKLMNHDKNSYAKICLEQGANLQELYIDTTPIIKDLSPLTYADTYASSLLFPFANRIKDGLYTFNEKKYQLDINQKEENNALHGLVYNKTFHLLEHDISDMHASIKLGYEEKEKSKGFPFTYRIELFYVFTKNNLSLNISVKNTDVDPFPFTLGWHPFFYSTNLHTSYLEFDSSKKTVSNSNMITIGMEDLISEGRFEIKDKQLDDCFVLDTNTILFNTPDYQLEMTASSKHTFLQMYTPNRSFIALEPTTGVSDSFNNKIGLQVLNSGETYSLDWAIKNINIH